MKILGKNENSERFLKGVLYQGKPLKNPVSAPGQSNRIKEFDPILICSAFKKNRFYVFSKREPEETDEKHRGFQIIYNYLFIFIF